MGRLLHQRWSLIVLLIQISFFYSSNSQPLTCHPRDLKALRDFNNEVEPKPAGWSWTLNSSSDCCEWVGITCNDRNNTARITKLELGSFGYSGILSDSLGQLDQIRVLNLSHNLFLGLIPHSIFNLVHLETLDLSYNHFYGQLPKSINIPSLKSLDLYLNELDGLIPAHVCHNSTDLRLIRLDRNYFSGDFPSGFEKCALLEHLSIGWNNLNGNIPEDLYHLQRLNLLEISRNNLSGSLSPGLGNFSRLVHLDVSANTFSGEIPDVFELESFFAFDNRFVGGIPGTLSNSRSLISLDLRNNLLSGPLLFYCDDVMTKLTVLDLGSNHFDGPLPVNLPACRNLNRVNLAQNRFHGQLPESFKDLKSLSYFSLSNCSLVNISSTLHILQQCENLTVLLLTSNLRGEMLPHDPSLHFEKLQTLKIGNSSLTGSMPSWLSKSTNLRLLDLSSNHLSGAIPNWFGGYTDLFYLDLSRNSITGEIPGSLSEMKRLQLLDLSNNRLTGSIPDSLQKLRSLFSFNVSNNNLSGRIPFGGRFQTFTDSSFAGNNLCHDCQANTSDSKQSKRTQGDDDFWLDFSYGVALGFGLSFLIVAYFTCSEFKLQGK